jgi:hypothetical protein
MITSDRQLNATKKKIDSLTESLAEMKKSAKGILAKSSIVQTEAMKQELENDVFGDMKKRDKDFIKDQSAKAGVKYEDKCDHKWVKTQGFTKIYHDCGKCGVQKGEE